MICTDDIATGVVSTEQLQITFHNKPQTDRPLATPPQCSLYKGGGQPHLIDIWCVCRLASSWNMAERSYSAPGVKKPLSSARKCIVVTFVWILVLI